jgi:hypothetical protein
MGARRWAFFSSLLDQVRELKGLLRIYAWCKKIRNDEDTRVQPEDYLRQHTHAEFTHGICPACKEKFLQGGWVARPTPIRRAFPLTLPGACD